MKQTTILLASLILSYQANAALKISGSNGHISYTKLADVVAAQNLKSNDDGVVLYEKRAQKIISKLADHRNLNRLVHGEGKELGVTSGNHQIISKLDNVQNYNPHSGEISPASTNSMSYSTQDMANLSNSMVNYLADGEKTDEMDAIFDELRLDAELAELSDEELAFEIIRAAEYLK